MYGIEGSIKYDAEFGLKKLKVETEKVVEEMRKQPEFKEIMPILDQPSCLALIKIISCFRKFDFEHEDVHVNEILGVGQEYVASRTASFAGSARPSVDQSNETMLSNEATVLLM